MKTLREAVIEECDKAKTALMMKDDEMQNKFSTIT
jgi:hypothetical protein